MTVAFVFDRQQRATEDACDARSGHPSRAALLIGSDILSVLGFISMYTGVAPSFPWEDPISVSTSCNVTSCKLPGHGSWHPLLFSQHPGLFIGTTVACPSMRLCMSHGQFTIRGVSRAYLCYTGNPGIPGRQQGAGQGAGRAGARGERRHEARTRGRLRSHLRGAQRPGGSCFPSIMLIALPWSQHVVAVLCTPPLAACMCPLADCMHMSVRSHAACSER